MTDAAARAIAQLQNEGWQFVPAATRQTDAPETSPSMSAAQVQWCSSFATLSAADDAVWFLSYDDHIESADEFAADEFETMSTDASESEAEKAAVAAFWARHHSLLLSVRGDYEFLAVRDDDWVVHGTGADFESTSVIARSLDDLLRAIAARDTRALGPAASLFFREDR